MGRWTIAWVLLLVLAVPAAAGDDESSKDPEVEKWFEILGTRREEGPFQALRALIALGEKAAPRAREVLNDERQSVERRWQSAKVLGAVRAKEALPDLLRWIDDRQPAVLGAVSAEAVGRLGDKTALPALQEKLAASRNDMTRDALKKAIVALGGTVEQEDAGPPPKKAAPAAAGSPEWVYVGSREEGRGARLLVETKGGGKREIDVAVDTMLISYIPQGVFGSMEKLSVDESDRNRMLVRFELANLKDVTAAHLVVQTAVSPIPLTRDLEIGVYPVSAAWNDQVVSWNTQPKFESEPLATLTITPKLGEVRADVTAAVRRGVTEGEAHHGWLLKARTPREPSGKPPARAKPDRALVNDLLGLVKWSPSPAEAVKKAAEEGKLALALVRAAHAPDAANFNEEVFLATVLADPILLDFVRARFVATRVHYRGWFYTLGKVTQGADPLAALGTSAAKVKPLALVVATGAGEHVATLQGIGTFDEGVVRSFICHCLLAAETKLWFAVAPGPDRQHYREGVESFVRGRLQEANRSWGRMAPESPWRLKVRAWRQWPERMAMYERMDAPDFSSFAPAEQEGPRPSTEVHAEGKLADRLVAHAVDYLLDKQQRDGSWPTAQPYAANIPGVTALVARALLMWRDAFEGKRRERIDAAIDRARVWCEAFMEKTDAAAANSFGTTYILDFYIDLLKGDRAFEPRVQKAVQYHTRGQAPNGGWGYDRNFALRWKGGFGGWPVTDKGRVHSMNTGPALLALARAKKAGLKVDRKALDLGKEALLAMRDEPAVFTYTWPEPRNFNKADTSIGRAPGCEHALLELGAAKPEHLDLAVENFMTYRADLRKVAKVTPGWTPPRAVSSYFYFFAYHHAARAILRLPKAQRDRRLAALRDDILGCVEIDGTWVDYLGVGKPYGTAMALMILRWAPPARGDK